MDIPLRGITLQEALDIAYESDNEVVDIYIQPPDCQDLTDEDSADEDGGGTAENLNGRQLLAPAEVVFSNGRRIGDTSEVTNADLENVQLPTVVQNDAKIESRLNVVTKSEKSEFLEGDLVYPDYKFQTPNYSQYENLSPVKLFELFFTEELTENIIKETRSYSLLKNLPDVKLTVEEMKVFIGILIVSGYNVLPTKRSYWENSKDMKNVLVSESMRRDRFLQICRCLHFASNENIDYSDKMYKLRPIVSHLKHKFLEHFVPEQNLSYDESMIKYYGRHGCKQFIRGKPIRFGYKVWCLNTNSGYLINFEIYQGKSIQKRQGYDAIFGKPAAPLIHMIEDLGDKKDLRYNFFIDNLFTGANLLCTLKANGYGATGTIRDDRIQKDVPIPSKKIMAKEARGTYASTLEKNDGILYVRWMDNNVVTMASTCFGVAPVKSVERFSRKDKRNVPIPRPDVISKYNKNMGGTDLMDANVSCYRIGVRSKKWYWSIFTYLIDVSIQNAWILYRKSGRNISQLEFRRSIAQTYLTNYKTTAKGPGRASKAAGSNSRVGDDVRFDGLNHFVVVVPEGKRRRCAELNCTSKGRTMCIKCNVGLCVECFMPFHTNN